MCATCRRFKQAKGPGGFHNTCAYANATAIRNQSLRQPQTMVRPGSWLQIAAAAARLVERASGFPFLAPLPCYHARIASSDCR